MKEIVASIIKIGHPVATNDFTEQSNGIPILISAAVCLRAQLVQLILKDKRASVFSSRIIFSNKRQWGPADILGCCCVVVSSPDNSFRPELCGLILWYNHLVHACSDKVPLDLMPSTKCHSGAAESIPVVVFQRLVFGVGGISSYVAEHCKVYSIIRSHEVACLESIANSS